MELKTLSPSTSVDIVNRNLYVKRSSVEDLVVNEERRNGGDKISFPGNKFEVSVTDVETESDENATPEVKVSCCYGVMVFVGLAISLLGLTLLVIYAGFWSNYAMQDHRVVLMVGGEVDGVPISRVSVHVLPKADSKCQSAPQFPLSVTGPVAVAMLKEVFVCGGLVKSDQNSYYKTIPDCIRLEQGRCAKMDELKIGRAFSASVYLPGRGWWITGGISVGNNEVLGLESPLSSTELIPIEDADKGDEYKFLVDEPNLPEDIGLSHHCLVRLDKYRVLLIGGMGEGRPFVPGVWLFDWKKRKWDEWTDLKYGRHSHACSLALGGEFVVVAGGETEHETVHGQGSQLAEIMEINTGHWHIMPHLPKPLWGGAFVLVNDLATLVGGYAGESTKASIQLIEKGEFKEMKLKFSPEIVTENVRKYSATIVAHEKFVCF